MIGALIGYLVLVAKWTRNGHKAKEEREGRIYLPGRARDRAGAIAVSELAASGIPGGSSGEGSLGIGIYPHCRPREARARLWRVLGCQGNRTIKSFSLTLTKTNRKSGSCTASCRQAGYRPWLDEEDLLECC